MINDYFLTILIRQRHEEILAEFRVIGLLRLKRPRLNCGMKGLIRTLRSFLAPQETPSLAYTLARDESQRT